MRNSTIALMFVMYIVRCYFTNFFANCGSPMFADDALIFTQKYTSQLRYIVVVAQP